MALVVVLGTQRYIQSVSAIRLQSAVDESQALFQLAQSSARTTGLVYGVKVSQTQGKFVHKLELSELGNQNSKLQEAVTFQKQFVVSSNFELTDIIFHPTRSVEIGMNGLLSDLKQPFIMTFDTGNKHATLKIFGRSGTIQVTD